MYIIPYQKLLTAARAEVERHTASHDEGKCPCELCSVVKSLP